MRQSVELFLIGALIVHLAFFSWPVPKLVRDVLHTGVGKLVVLSGISYLALYQSPALAILGAIFYSKSVHAAYHEGFTADADKCKDRSKLSMEEKKECAKWEATKDSHKTVEEHDPSRKAASGDVSSHKGSSAGAKAHESGKTEHYENFAPF
jgi:hypothetical protein